MTNPADFKEFIQKFPASPFAREAQFRIDLFDNIRRAKKEAEELERLAFEAENKRKEVAANAAAAAKRAEQAARQESQRAEQAALERERQAAAEDRDSQRSPPTIVDTGYNVLWNIGVRRKDTVSIHMQYSTIMIGRLRS